MQRLDIWYKNEIVAEATVDDEDYLVLSQYVWRLHCKGYAYRSVGSGRKKTYKTILMHRQIIGENVEMVDHKDLNKLNNQKYNLRVVTVSQNNQNITSRKGSTSKHRGVHWSERDKRWYAKAGVNKKTIYIGSYLDELEAAEAASQWRRENMPYAMED